jgi:hypothetical protein
MLGLLQTCLGDAEARTRLNRLASQVSDDVQRLRVEAAIAQLDDGPCPKELRTYHKEKFGGARH